MVTAHIWWKIMTDAELRLELAEVLRKNRTVREQVIAVMNLLGKNGYLKGERDDS